MGYIPYQRGIVYGPVSSKRFGRSFGINLTPKGRKICTFNCLYCFYGPTEESFSDDFPSVEEVVDAVEKGLKEVGEIDYITFAGNGEPTLHPHFDDVVRGVRRLRDKIRPDVPIAVLSNATQLASERIRRSLRMIDTPVMKLDTADETTFQAINRPLIQVRIKDIIDMLVGLDDILIQTVCVCGSVSNITSERTNLWFKALNRIAPREVQLYTLDEPLENVGLVPCPDNTLLKIADTARTELVKVSLYF